MKRTKLTKREVQRFSSIANRLAELMAQYEDENDIQLQTEGNGSVADNLSCALAGLETILQEYDD